MDVPDALRNGQVLIALFAVLAFGSAIGTVLVLGGTPTELAYALVAGLIVALVVIGAYRSGLRYGQPHSHAVAVAAVSFGAVLTLAVVAELLIASERLSTIEVAAGLVGFVVAMAILVGIVHLVDRRVSPS